MATYTGTFKFLIVKTYVSNRVMSLFRSSFLDYTQEQVVSVAAVQAILGPKATF